MKRKYLTLALVGMLSIALTVPGLARDNDRLGDWIRRYEKNNRHQQLSPRQQREIQNYIRQQYKISQRERNLLRNVYRDYHGRRYHDNWLADLLSDRRLSNRERRKIERILQDRYVHDWYRNTYGYGNLPPGIARQVAQGRGLPPGLARQQGGQWHPAAYGVPYGGYYPGGGNVIGAIIQDLVLGRI